MQVTTAMAGRTIREPQPESLAKPNKQIIAMSVAAITPVIHCEASSALSSDLISSRIFLDEA